MYKYSAVILIFFFLEGVTFAQVKVTYNEFDRKASYKVDLKVQEESELEFRSANLRTYLDENTEIYFYYFDMLTTEYSFNLKVDREVIFLFENKRMVKELGKYTRLMDDIYVSTIIFSKDEITELINSKSVRFRLHGTDYKISDNEIKAFQDLKETIEKDIQELSFLKAEKRFEYLSDKYPTEEELDKKARETNNAKYKRDKDSSKNQNEKSYSKISKPIANADTNIQTEKNDLFELKIEGSIERELLEYTLPENIPNTNGIVSFRFQIKTDGSLGLIIPLKKIDAELEKEIKKLLRSWSFSKFPKGFPQQTQWGSITFRFKEG